MTLAVIDTQNMVLDIVTPIDSHISVLDQQEGILTLDIDNMFGKSEFKEFINKKLKPKDHHVSWLNEVDFFVKAPDWKHNDLDQIGYYMEVVKIKHK